MRLVGFKMIKLMIDCVFVRLCADPVGTGTGRAVAQTETQIQTGAGDWHHGSVQLIRPHTHSLCPPAASDTHRSGPLDHTRSRLRVCFYKDKTTDSECMWCRFLIIWSDVEWVDITRNGRTDAFSCSEETIGTSDEVTWANGHEESKDAQICAFAIVLILLFCTHVSTAHFLTCVTAEFAQFTESKIISFTWDSDRVDEDEFHIQQEGTKIQIENLSCAMF